MSFPGRHVQRAWHLIDASSQTVGRLAATIAPILKGKHKPTYRPNADCGDFVVVINADKVHFSGKKWTDKLYRHHTGYPGGLKSRRALDVLQRKPESILRKAVLGMLSRNNLRHKYIEPRLKIYAGSDHPHVGQVGDSSKMMEPVPRKKEANYHFGLVNGYAGATLPKGTHPMNPSTSDE
uniref:50S ribosomal protein L13 n=1 Tax=Helicotheca tamesis TaxID=374047 RepID=A0A7S2HZS3_9STRA|mmetsp:Transcript_4141/g.5612  ORF Transcript_4141/g.5612 Transcript_4141/m.5612 type:complete len:180 (+) Transcript_4141:37-576(+)